MDLDNVNKNWDGLIIDLLIFLKLTSGESTWRCQFLSRQSGEPKGWEMIFSVYLMISLNPEVFRSLSQCSQRDSESQKNTTNFSTHQQWNHQDGWKNVLNNLRLIIQPTIILWLIFPWLDVFPDRYLLLGFHRLIQNINLFQSYFPDG